MNEKEVIEIINDVTWSDGGRHYGKIAPARDLSVKALEKQIAQKPLKMTFKGLLAIGWEYECPTCHCAVGLNKNAIDYTQEDNYCPTCGQKLDWVG